MRFRQIRDWCGKKIMAFVIAGLFVFLGLALRLPPYENFIVWEGRLELAANLILGAIEIPLLVFSPSHLITRIIWFGFFGFIIGLAVQFLWLKGKLGKIVIVSVILLNVPPGLFFFSLSNARFGEPESCVKYISATNGLKIVAYPEGGFLGGTQLFYLATRDAGNHWKQIMHLRYDDPISPKCDTLRYLDPNNYWVWTYQQLAVTHDGGKTWLSYRLTCNPFGQWKKWISDVNFASAQIGSITFYSLDERKSLLYTNDGGKTWKEAGEWCNETAVQYLLGAP